MSAQSFEIVLARLYTDPEFRKAFLENPEETLKKCELNKQEVSDLRLIDKAGLVMASNSFSYKRNKRGRNFLSRVGILFKLWIQKYMSLI